MSHPQAHSPQGKPLPPLEQNTDRSTLVTGSSGFIGSSIVLALGSEPWSKVTLLHRQPRPGIPGATVATGDIRDKYAVEAAVDGVDTIVHSASYIGPDSEMCHDVNVSGTTNLVNAALRLNAPNLIYISTTAVYGSGPHRNARIGTIREAPNSAVSRSRLLAERIVLDAGGSVVRPALVYGIGDTWVLPSLSRLTSRLGGLIDGGRARTSIIRANDLGFLINSAARALPQIGQPKVWHAANIQPVTLFDLIAQTYGGNLADLGIPAVPREVALESASKLGITTRQVDLASLDHWYESAHLWIIAKRESPPAVVLTDAEHAWYRKQPQSRLDQVPGSRRAILS